MSLIYLFLTYNKMIEHIFTIIFWNWFRSTYSCNIFTTTLISSVLYALIRKAKSPNSSMLNDLTLNLSSKWRVILESLMLLTDTYFEITIFFQIFLFLRFVDVFTSNYEYISMCYHSRHSIINGLEIAINALQERTSSKPRKRRARYDA